MARQAQEANQEGLEQESRSKPKPTAYIEMGLSDLAKDAKIRYDNANEAARTGDWARYGEELKMLEETLIKLESLTDPGSVD